MMSVLSVFSICSWKPEPGGMRMTPLGFLVMNLLDAISSIEGAIWLASWDRKMMVSLSPSRC